MDSEYRENLDKLMEITKAPLIDKLEKALGKNTTLKEINKDMLDVLEHVVNWGHGFEGTGSRPEWLTEAENILSKISPKILADVAIRHAEKRIQ